MAKKHVMIPELNKDFICLVNRDSVVLTALVSSYLNTAGRYLPVFEIGKTLCKKEDFPGGVHKYSISHRRAEEFNVRTQNASKFLNPDLTVVLVGLDDNLKSYLDWIDEFNLIYIEDQIDVENYLGYLLKDREVLSIRSPEIVLGSYQASIENKVLKIDEDAPNLIYRTPIESGSVLVEEGDSTCNVIAANYAVSIKSEFRIIPKPDIEKREINELVELWKKEDDERYFRDLGAKIFPSIESVDFETFQYATIFTNHSPYALFVEGDCLITYVASNLHPDFFVFNNILYEYRKSIDSAIVFSPLLFGVDEETPMVLESFKNSNYYVEALIGEDASVANIDNLVKEFPFQVLHFCSHGGQVDGYSLKEKIADQKGIEHFLEYDEIVSFGPQRGEEKIVVTTKYIFRKLNGLHWNSEELKEKEYSSDFYAYLLEGIMKSEGKSREPKKDITDSCGIICYHFFYQAMFDTLASNVTNPLVFNNTCWSWLNISENFLALGCRSYIGTYWNIDNDNAKKAAEKFYETVLEKTILEAYGEAIEELKGTKDENVYGLWGLHFSTLSISDDIEQNKFKIANQLLYSLNYWKRKRGTSNNPETEVIVGRKINWIADKISDSFQIEAMILIAKAKKRK